MPDVDVTSTFLLLYHRCYEVDLTLSKIIDHRLMCGSRQRDGYGAGIAMRSTGSVFDSRPLRCRAASDPGQVIHACA